MDIKWVTVDCQLVDQLASIHCLCLINKLFQVPTKRAVTRI